jgi:hypothetical protein
MDLHRHERLEVLLKRNRLISFLTTLFQGHESSNDSLTMPLSEPNGGIRASV